MGRNAAIVVTWVGYVEVFVAQPTGVYESGFDVAANSGLATALAEALDLDKVRMPPRRTSATPNASGGTTAATSSP